MAAARPLSAAPNPKPKPNARASVGGTVLAGLPFKAKLLPKPKPSFSGAMSVDAVGSLAAVEAEVEFVFVAPLDAAGRAVSRDAGVADDEVYQGAWWRVRQSEAKNGR